MPSLVVPTISRPETPCCTVHLERSGTTVDYPGKQKGRTSTSLHDDAVLIIIIQSTRDLIGIHAALASLSKMHDQYTCIVRIQLSREVVSAKDMKFDCQSSRVE